MIRLRPEPELRVLFVCTANVCRSPLAEGLMRHRLRSMNVNGRIHVSSAGICAAQRGRRPDPRMVRLAVEAGVSMARIRSRMLTPWMVQRSDHVLVMENSHLHEVTRLCAGTPFEGKARLLGDFLPPGIYSVSDIPDPYFGDLESLRDVYELIDSALSGFLTYIDTM